MIIIIITVTPDADEVISGGGFHSQPPDRWERQ